MSSFEPSQPVPVRVTADKGTEIFVIDHNFDLKISGVDEISDVLVPGIYKFKFKVGSLIREIHQSIPPDSPLIEISGPEMPFESSAPLRQTRWTQEPQEQAAARLSRRVLEHIGEGSGIFVFARPSTDDDEHSSRTSERNPLHGLTLHDSQGRLLLSFEELLERQPGPGAWAGGTVGLDPGTYRLRVSSPVWGALEQSIVTTKGWQTQIFLQVDQDDGVVDPATATILQARQEVGFDPTRADYRLTELARIGLVNGRAVIASRDWQQMLYGKFDNPMLGLYGAHALLMEGDLDVDRLQHIIANLEKLVGTHPDVEALKLRLPTRAPYEYRHESPPMLSASWSLVVESSVERPGIVPEGSLAARVSPYLWGTSPWLIWLVAQVENVPIAEEMPLTNSLEQISASLEQISAFGSDETLLADDLHGVDLTVMEEALLAAVVGFSDSLGASDLAESLELPPAAIKELGSSLAWKLGSAEQTDTTSPGTSDA